MSDHKIYGIFIDVTFFPWTMFWLFFFCLISSEMAREKVVLGWTMNWGCCWVFNLCSVWNRRLNHQFRFGWLLSIHFDRYCLELLRIYCNCAESKGHLCSIFLIIWSNAKRIYHFEPKEVKRTARFPFLSFFTKISSYSLKSFDFDGTWKYQFLWVVLPQIELVPSILDNK